MKQAARLPSLLIDDTLGGLVGRVFQQADYQTWLICTPKELGGQI
jgi:hypothetical protein